jgi:hypothetical protein
VIIALICAGTLGASAIVFRPPFLFGGEVVAPLVKARVPGHQALIDHVAGLVSGSVAVLAIHERNSGQGSQSRSDAIGHLSQSQRTVSVGFPTPLTEIVLWMKDVKNPGELDRGEVAVLSHSRVLQTITLYVADPSYLQTGMIDPHRAATRAFCDGWRADPSVKGIVIATGISDLWIERPGKSDSSVISMRINLTWASDSADGSDAASAQVDAIRGPQPVAAATDATGGP